MTPIQPHPAGHRGGQSDLAAALLDPDRACPDGLCTWNGSDPTARLAVHRNNVVSSLVDALAATFPVVQELVGETFFRAMAGVFVRCSPPRSRVLAYYGQDFPPFVAQFGPAQTVPYLSDVARLEAARVRAYHAADAAPVSAEAVGLAMAAGSERLGELHLTLHPSLSTVESRHGVVSLWAAHQGEGGLGRWKSTHPSAPSSSARASTSWCSRPRPVPPPSWRPSNAVAAWARPLLSRPAPHRTSTSRRRCRCCWGTGC